MAATGDVVKTSIPVPAPAGQTMAGIQNTETALYNVARTALESQRMGLPSSAAVAGNQARVDRDQGVSKAPGNVAVMAVLGQVSKITGDDQTRLNIDPTAGKSINAIRAFTGNGTLGVQAMPAVPSAAGLTARRMRLLCLDEPTERPTGVGHILLRPLPGDRWQQGVPMRPASTPEPFSLRLSVVLPVQAGRLADPGLRRHITQTLADETPARLLWLDAPTLAAFHTLHARWLALWCQAQRARFGACRPRCLRRWRLWPARPGPTTHWRSAARATGGLTCWAWATPAC